jgi:hypothetical protein
MRIDVIQVLRFGFFKPKLLKNLFCTASVIDFRPHALCFGSGEFGFSCRSGLVISFQAAIFPNEIPVIKLFTNKNMYSHTLLLAAREAASLCSQPCIAGAIFGRQFLLEYLLQNA